MCKTILIVDDEEPILFAMQEYFKDLGYNVDCARDKPQAEFYLATREYAMVIADLRLSGVADEEGLEIVARARGSSPSTRTMVLTAYGSPEIEARAMSLGADAFLHKPQPLPNVAELVAKLLRGKNHEPGTA
ncbi:MAG: response regulator [Pyrinomonadaceae bacterium]